MWTCLALSPRLPPATTGAPPVFAGGDVICGAATVVAAVAEGMQAAKGIDRYLRPDLTGNEGADFSTAAG